MVKAFRARALVGPNAAAAMHISEPTWLPRRGQAIADPCDQEKMSRAKAAATSTPPMARRILTGGMIESQWCSQISKRLTVIHRTGRSGLLKFAEYGDARQLLDS